MNARVLVALAALTITLPLTAWAQGVGVGGVALARAFVTGGVGTGSHGVAGALALSLGTGRGDFSIRWLGATDVDLVNFFGPPSRSASDVSVLYGLRFVDESTWARVSAGVGRAQVREPGPAHDCAPFCDYDLVTEGAWGLAFQGDVLWARGAMGVGLSALGNVSGAGTLAAVMLTLHVGQLR